MANADLHPAAESDSDASEREALLQLLYLCPIAIAKLDERGNIVLMNPHGTQLLMTLSRDGELNNLFDLFAPFAPEVGEMALRYEKRTGKICEAYRFVVRHDDRVDHPTTISLTLQKVDTGVFVAVISDVTATAVREVRIRTSEERLHSVLDGVKDYAICTVDLDGCLTSWNQAAERLEGYRSDEVMGRHIDMLAPASRGSAGPFKKPFELAKQNGGHDFEAWRVRKDGSRYWASCTISSLSNKSDRALLGFSIITRDTTVSRRSEDNLRLLATTDSLTGALNRRAFFDAAKAEQARCRLGNEPLSMLFLDVDHFKKINDVYGHEAGDVILQRVVAEVRAEIRTGDLLARVGGEEFVVLLTGSLGLTSAIATAERIRSRIASLVIPVSAGMANVTVSIGVRSDEGQAVDIETMWRAADGAMYEAKHEGRNRVVTARDKDAA